jgi:hypothetical protein
MADAAAAADAGAKGGGDAGEARFRE